MLGVGSPLIRNLFCRGALLYCVFALFPPSVCGQQEHTLPKRVLFLYPFDSDQGIYTGIDRVLRSRLRSLVHARMEFYVEYLDLIRFPTPEHAQNLVKSLRLKYSEKPPDLVVPISYSATQFLAYDGKDLFPGTPAVALFNARRLEDIKNIAVSNHRSITGIAGTDEPTRSLDLALRLQPDTKKVAIIVDNSLLDTFWLDQLKNDFSPYAKSLEITYLTGSSMQGLLEALAHLPTHTVVLALFYFEDANGQFFQDEEAIDLITRAADVPVYSIYTSDIGHGVVGGHMTNPERIGGKLADDAASVLNGTKAGAIPIAVDNSAQDTVDGRQLHRWGIGEKGLPPGAVELFREPTTWEHYHSLIIGVISVLLLQALLIVALTLNMSRRLRAEKALRKEKAFSDAVIESLPGMFLLQDRTGNNLRWNKNAELLLSHHPKEASDLLNVAERNRDAVRRAREEFFEEGSGQMEIEVLLKDGKAAAFHISAVRVEAEGRPHMAAVCTDLTEIKTVEEAVRRSEAELRSFIENAPYGIGTISLTLDRFLRANPALVRMLGYRSESELLTLVVSRDLYCDGDSVVLQSQPGRAGFFSSVEFTWRRKDGKSVHLRASGRRFSGTSDQGDLIEVIAEDTTARRLLEEQLHHAQKMEALGKLAGSIAHDFNNLLGVIIGYAELISHQLNVEGRTIPHLEKIKRAGQHATSLTAQLLAFSRRQVLQPRVLNVNSLVRETQKMLQRLVGEDIEQKSILDPALWKTRVDASQLVQVLMNLSVNARDAMPQGGKLEIETANVTFVDGTTVCDVEVPAGDYVQLSVRDTGEGMSPETQLHIFEPFFTTKEPGKGTGLGLATVYGIVKQSGGYIFAESELGKGTTFRVYLPRVDSAAIAVTEPASTTDFPQRSKTVLVVEDEPAFRDLLRDGLQSRGYQVLVAANGVEALRIAGEYNGPIHLLITDVIMPQMSGAELAKCLKQVRGGTDVLYMSGYTDDKVQVISSVGELRLMQKPFSIQELERKIEEILMRKEGEVSATILPHKSVGLGSLPD